MMHNIGKGLVYHLQTAKIQISMPIPAVWSGLSLSTDMYYSIQWVCKRTEEAQVSLHKMCRLIWACVSKLQFVCSSAYDIMLLFIWSILWDHITQIYLFSLFFEEWVHFE